MGDILIKPSRDEDFYILWSLTVDAPISWGSRADLEALAPKYFPTNNRIARFNRADEHSASTRGPEIPSWDVDTEYTYHLRYTIKRSRLKELIDVLKTLPNDGSQDECGDVMVLMEPEDDE